MQCTLFCTQGACILIRANHYHRLSRWFVFRPIRTLFLCWSLKTHRKVRQPQHQLLAKLPGLITFSCFWLIKWLANLFYYIIGGFLHNAEAIPTTRRAGGLFVLQSSVFRINEKLLNGEQGPALTTKHSRPIWVGYECHFWFIFYIKRACHPQAARPFSSYLILIQLSRIFPQR